MRVPDVLGRRSSFEQNAAASSARGSEAALAQRDVAGALMLAPGILLALIPWLWLCRVTWPFTVDDTFITLRYAKNLALGHGLVWNPGEAPVEGYTSWLWTVLLAPFHAWMTDAERAAKGLGLVVTLGALVGAAKLGAQLTAAHGRLPRLLAGWLAPLALALQPGTAVHAVSGMDTALFTALLTWFFVALVGCRAPSATRLRAAALVGLLTCLTRPEGTVAVVIGGTALAFTLPAVWRRRWLGTAAVLFVLPGAVFWVWRLLEYELPFPLPFYVKAVGQGTFWAGLGEARAFLNDIGWRVPLLGALALVGLVGARRHAAPALVGALALFLFFLKPAPLMAYEHRYLFPLLPLWCAAAAAGSANLLEGATRRGLSAPAARGALTAGLALALTLPTWSNTRAILPGILAEKLSYAAGLEQAHIRLGQSLARLRADRPQIALLDVGAVAYYSDWRVLDTFGLNDRHIALHGRGHPDYVLEQGPDLVVVVSKTGGEYVPVFDYEAPLHAASRARGYELTASLEFVPDYHLLVLAHPDYPQRAELAAALR